MGRAHLIQQRLDEHGPGLKIADRVVHGACCFQVPSDEGTP